MPEATSGSAAPVREMPPMRADAGPSPPARGERALQDARLGPTLSPVPVWLGWLDRTLRA